MENTISKPPMIAYTQFLGTLFWGDSAFGIRFFSPVIAAVIGVAVLRFFAREVNARAGFFLLLILSATGFISPPIALCAGIVFGLAFLHPFADDSRALAR